MTPGSILRQEIASQPDVWQSALDAYREQAGRGATVLAEIRRKHIFVVGCGSTYYLSQSAAAILRKFGFHALALPASELVYFPETLPAQRGEASLLAISRSGITTETLWAAESFRQRYPGGPIIALTAVPDSRLSRLADITLVAAAAQEKSIPSTRSFTSLFILSQALAGTLAADHGTLERLGLLPGALRRLFERAGDLPRRIGEDLSIQRLFFLGGGPLYGLACEAMLKTKEISSSWSEAYHPLELRHGPTSVVDEASLVVGFISDIGAGAEAALLHDVKKLGARTLVLTADAGQDWDGLDDVVELGGDLDEWQRGALYLPLIQQLAYHRALAKGLDPDRPRNLNAVIELPSPVPDTAA